MLTNRMLRSFAVCWLVSTGGFAQAAGPSAPASDAHLIRLGNDYYSVVSNHASAAMSAYAIVITMYGSGEHIRHYYDVRMQRQPTIQPGATFQEGHSGIVLGASLLAAVFVDGTTLGNAKEVASLMERRRAKLTALTTMASALCEATSKGTDMQALVSALEVRGRASQNSVNGMTRAVQRKEYDTILEKLKRPGVDAAGALADALKLVHDEGAPLLKDPIKDANGKLYLQETADRLGCGEAAAAALGTSQVAGGQQRSLKPYSAHPIIALREGYYVRTGLDTDHWPEKRERVLQVAIDGEEITVVELARDSQRGAAEDARPVFHGTYVSNPFVGEWGRAKGKMPMTVVNPERFLFGTEGASSGFWNRLSDNAVQPDQH